MAYGLIMMAVSSSELDSFLHQLQILEQKEDIEGIKKWHIKPNKVIFTTHYYVSSGTGEKELDKLIYDTFDGGKLISKFYWHPYRPPKYHDKDSIKALLGKFIEVCEQCIAKQPEHEIEYWKQDFDPVLELFRYIIKNELTLITLLDKPFDEERANKVFGPIEI